MKNITALLRIKYMEINLTKSTQYLYPEKQKPALREMYKDPIAEMSHSLGSRCERSESMGPSPAWAWAKPNFERDPRSRTFR